MKACGVPRGVKVTPPGPTRALLLTDLDEQLALEHVDQLVGFGVRVQRGGLAPDHDVLEHEELIAGVVGQQLPRVEAAAPERLLVAFAGCSDDRNQIAHLPTPVRHS